MKTLLKGLWYYFLIMTAICLLSSLSKADSFDCETDGSLLKEDQYSYFECGVGEGHLESEARLNAVKNTTDIFNAGHPNIFKFYKVRIFPKRLVCKERLMGWKCYNLTQYLIRGKKL